MARIFTSGAETGDLNMWSSSTASTNYAVAASSTRSRSTGTYAYRFNRTSGFSGNGCYVTFSSTSSAEIIKPAGWGDDQLLVNGEEGDALYIRFYLFVEDAADAGTKVLDIVRFLSSGGTRLGGFGYIGNSIQLQIGGTQRDVFTPTEDTWYCVYLELHESPTTAGFATCAAHIYNESSTTMIASATTDLVISSDIEVLRFGMNVNFFAGAGTADWYIDDIAINDNRGTHQNTYPSPGACIGVAVPTSEGGTIEWSPSTGTDNSALIDEYPAAAVDTTDYVDSTATATTCEDRYGFTDSSTVGGGVTGTVTAIQTLIRYGNHPPSSEQVISYSDGVWDGSNRTERGINWTGNVTEAWVGSSIGGTGATAQTAWTNSSYDAAELFIRRNAAIANDRGRVWAVCAEVEESNSETLPFGTTRALRPKTT